MYWVSKLLAIAATGALGTNAMEVSIFRFPSGHLESGSVTVSEDFAQLALKMGVESSLASVLHGMEAEVDHLDQFVDTQMPLFGSNHEVPGRSLIVLEGLPVEAGMNMRKKHVPNLLVPGASNNLVDESFISIMEGDSKGSHCIYQRGDDGKTKSSSTVKDCLSKSPVLSRDQKLFGHDLLDLIDSVETWVSKDQKTTASRLSFKTVSSDKILYIKPLESIFQDLAKLSSTDSWVATAVLATSEYGSEVRGNISRRGETSRIEPSDAQDDLQFSPRDLPLHSNLAPVCYASNSTCTETTNNCSGHGYCYLKYGSGSDATAGNCYACRCQQTMVRKKDGTTQKVQWGGPACQKKDISSPFLLIAGVSVFAVIMVSTAIGMLFSMGQQELPSVIGAGVGGSKAQT
ncbi:hypothetical protein N7466_011276 [Penicillium verhagenii]|uniref:uncharacterized protein n=1 Tax=Penicillium verhagenii TaxID=1562060 RepID=UPI0025458B93|nr:uncharacterized protein N7466_011276 [Penicillium verhagenii]KAJ5915343.1 hypothetical protein N7466_011276 [Penicillium verhagenii]